MKKEERNSSFELLRIISMLLIIIGHIIYNGDFFTNSSHNLYPIIMLMELLLIIHVNSYILVTGYFQSQSKFNLKKIVNLFLNEWFYRLIFLAVILILNYRNGISFNLSKTITNNLYNYWFINVYIVLYVLSPFLNLVITKLNRKGYLILLGSMFFFCSILTSCTIPSFISNHNGYSLVNFVLLYFIGGYFRKFPIQELPLFKNKSKKNNCLIFLGFLLVFAGINYGMFVLSQYLIPKYAFWGNGIKAVILHYDNPLVILGAISYFLIFYFIEIKSTFINFISKFNLDVYFIHENALIKKYIYIFFGFNLAFYNSYSWIGRIVP